MQNKIVGAFIVLLFVLSGLVEGAYADRLEIRIVAKLPSPAQKVLDAIDSVVVPIKDSLDLDMLERALPKKEKATKKLDAPALRWDFDKRQVKFARR